MNEVQVLKWIARLSIIASLIVFYGTAFSIRQDNEIKYALAEDALNKQDFQTALDIFSPLGEFQDSQKYKLYVEAILSYENKDYAKAIEQFTQLGNFLESEEYLAKSTTALKQIKSVELYNEACKYFLFEEYGKAYNIFKRLGEYEDSLEMAEESRIAWQLQLTNTISAGVIYSAGITKDGQVRFSGRLFDGKGEIESWTDIVSIAVNGEYIVGLKKDGTVVTASQFRGQEIDTSGWKDVVAISAGNQFFVALKEDGTVLAAGKAGYTEKDVENWTGIVTVDTGWQHTVGLDKEGTIHITGNQAADLKREIAEHRNEWTGIVAISTGGSIGNRLGRGHVVGLKSDGRVVAVGDNSEGQCNVGEWEDIVAIAAGDYHTVGLKSDGTVVTTQSEEKYSHSYRSINEWRNIVAISAGYGLTLGLQSNGTVVAAGNWTDGQSDVDLWTDIASCEDVRNLIVNESSE